MSAIAGAKASGDGELDSAGFNAETAAEMRKDFLAEQRRDGSTRSKIKLTKEQKREYKAVRLAGGGVIQYG